MTNGSFHHGYLKVRGVLAGGYSMTLRPGIVLDHAVRDGKAMYAMVEPFLRQLADTGNANKARTQGLSQYEHLRGQAMGLHDRVQGAGQRMIHIGY